MSGLRKAIEAKKRAAEAAAASIVAEEADPAPAPAPAPARAPAEPAKPDGGMKQGFLSGGSLYPEGSREAAPALWRRGGSGTADGAAPLFTLVSDDAAAYTVVGEFKQAGRYVGKEDFAVTREGQRLHIVGNPSADPMSLVSGLDEYVSLPLDAVWEGKTISLSALQPLSPSALQL